MIPFFNVCTGVLLKMKCKLKRALLIWSVILTQNTKLLVFLLFLVHHIFSLLTCCKSWHFPSPVFEGSCSVWVLPPASPQRVPFLGLPAAAASLLSLHPSLPQDILHSLKWNPAPLLSKGCCGTCKAPAAAWIFSKQHMPVAEWVLELKMPQGDEEKHERRAFQRALTLNWFGAQASMSSN